jgi:hypothetical protein
MVCIRGTIIHVSPRSVYLASFFLVLEKGRQCAPPKAGHVWLLPIVVHVLESSTFARWSLYLKLCNPFLQLDLSPYYVKAAQENMDYFYGELCASHVP